MLVQSQKIKKLHQVTNSRRKLFLFHFWVTNSKFKNKKFHFELLTRSQKIKKLHFKLVTRSQKIKTFSSTYYLEVEKQKVTPRVTNSVAALLFFHIRVTNLKLIN